MEEDELEPHHHQLHPLEQSQQQQQLIQQHYQQQQEPNEDEPHIDRNNNDLRFDGVGLQVADDEHVYSTTSPPPPDQSTSNAQPATADQSTSNAQSGTADQSIATAQPETGDQSTATAQPETGDQSTATAQPATSDHSTATVQPATSDQSTATALSATENQSTATVQPATSDQSTATALSATADQSTDKCAQSATNGNPDERVQPSETELMVEAPPQTGATQTERRVSAAADREADHAQAVEEGPGACRMPEAATEASAVRSTGLGPSRTDTQEGGGGRRPAVTLDAPMSARRHRLDEEADLSDDDYDRIVFKRSVPVLREEAELRARIHGHITSMLQGGWARAASRQLHIRRLVGGMSNELYYVRLSSRVHLGVEEPRRVLVRFFAQPSKTPSHPLVLEAIVFTIMSELHRGPRLYGCFDAGRVEEWIPAEPLGAGQLSHPAVSRLIARQLAVIHSMTTPLAKDPRWIWHSLEEWMKFFTQHSDMIDLDLLLRGANLRETFCIDVLRRHLRWLKNIIEMRRPHVVFCHNDLHGGNILYRSEALNLIEFAPSPQAVVEEDMAIPGTSSESEEALIERVLKRRAVFPPKPGRWRTAQHRSSSGQKGSADSTKESRSDSSVSSLGKSVKSEDNATTASPAVAGKADHMDDRGPIIFIDFEYSSYNYLCYDLANHFNEWMYEHDVRILPSFGFDASQYPTRDQQRAFLLEYLAASNVPSDVISDVADKHLNDMDAFSALSHFFWSLWSLQRYFVTTRPHFDYLAYAVNRMVMFLEFRSRVSEAFRQAAATSSHVQEEDSEEEYEDDEDEDDEKDDDGDESAGVS